MKFVFWMSFHSKNVNGNTNPPMFITDFKPIEATDLFDAVHKLGPNTVLDIYRKNVYQGNYEEGYLEFAFKLEGALKTDFLDVKEFEKWLNPDAHDSLDAFDNYEKLVEEKKIGEL